MQSQVSGRFELTKAPDTVYQACSTAYSITTHLMQLLCFASHTVLAAAAAAALFNTHTYSNMLTTAVQLPNRLPTYTMCRGVCGNSTPQQQQQRLLRFVHLHSACTIWELVLINVKFRDFWCDDWMRMFA